MSERAYGRLLDKCEKLEADNARLRALVKDLADDELDMDHRARVVALAAKEPKPSPFRRRVYNPP